mmetsp:Transcript_25529/g.31390  ORF Transcript_25529/g.31390 Transcript_25529/m.31390 type:complete len:467 (+) Transcript_25529:259-1659(+)
MNEEQRHMRVSYISDVEGNISYFKKYVERSKIVSFDKDGNLKLSENGIFVFGGDIFDKGPGDIRIARLVINLKRKYPDRCYLLIGNRDANKLRFTSELSDDDVENRPLDEVPPIPCVGNKLKPLHFIKENAHKGYENDKITRLKWMLKETLGSPDTFEFRREELAILSGRNDDEISDEEVIASFLESVQEGGFVVEYLKLAQIGVILHDTLFVHGGVNVESCGFVPDYKKFRYFDRATGDVVVKSVDDIPGFLLPENHTVEDWINHLNAFADDALNHYLQSPFWQEKDGIWIRGGEALMAYQSTPATQGRGVIVPTFVDGGKVSKFSEKLVQYLQQSRLSRIIVGHKPVADSPLVIRDDGALEVIMADTSYSDSSSADNRGDAVAEVIVEPDGSALVHGVLSDGKEYNFILPAVHEMNTGNLIGKKTKDDFWIKAKLEDQTLLLVKTEGRKVTRKYISPHEVKAHL